MGEDAAAWRQAGGASSRTHGVPLSRRHSAAHPRRGLAPPSLPPPQVSDAPRPGRPCSSQGGCTRLPFVCPKPRSPSPPRHSSTPPGTRYRRVVTGRAVGRQGACVTASSPPPQVFLAYYAWFLPTTVGAHAHTERLLERVAAACGLAPCCAGPPPAVLRRLPRAGATVADARGGDIRRERGACAALPPRAAPGIAASFAGHADRRCGCSGGGEHPGQYEYSGLQAIFL